MSTGQMDVSVLSEWVSTGQQTLHCRPSFGRELNVSSGDQASLLGMKMNDLMVPVFN